MMQFANSIWADTTRSAVPLSGTTCVWLLWQHVLYELMEDDRFLLRSQKNWKVVQDEHKYLASGPEYFFSEVSASLNVDCHLYGTCVLESSLTSIAYLHMDLFASLTTTPLKHALGDVAANVEGFKNEEDISDPLTLKAKTLAELGLESDVVAGITLFKEASLSTKIVEETQASGR